MRRRKNLLYMKCVDGQFVLQGQPIGSVVDVQILEVNYWLLKWVDGKVVKRRRLKEGGRWPKGYELSVELIIEYLGRDVVFTVYGRGVTDVLNPYLQQIALSGLKVGNLITRIICWGGSGGNFLEFNQA
ncbi:hypothetical protein [Halodesulfovibrio marinisediminis]|uniref:Uncharacterized protein n=1 Tax=Halodesulfovibrio marinisediminis DSM 17456 TaxID=1121457 RepID=A0A1N6IFB3_9BACT|nr:hypothetical protein [Halodesulfovibrio marinisediminis]SIO30710.1 hypothetical protein SAMN02745161_2693 [Halodesulfovibrio marinisediminis DSM 17456]